MALKRVIEKAEFEALADALKGEYALGDDGKYHLSVENDPAFEALKDEKRKLAERLKAFEDLTPEKLAELKKIDPAEYAKLKAAAEESAAKEAAEAEKRAKEAGNFEELKSQILAKHRSDIEQINNKHQEVLDVKDKRISYLENTVNKTLVENVAEAAIREAKGIPELLLHKVRERVKVIEEDGVFQVRVVAEDGKTIKIGDSKGTPMTISQLVEELKADPKFGRAFEGSGASGTGAKNEPTSEVPAGTKPVAEMSTKEKSEFISKHGYEKFAALL